MDIKSMAKSKRSHTKHNQPRKPNHPTLRPTSSNANHPAISHNKKTETKKVVHLKPPLSSNWDRYDDDVDEELGLPVPVSEAGGVAGDYKVKMAVEGVKVKSKGADFGYLIEQAKENNRNFNPPRFGDTLDDFYQGFTSMFDAKSEGIPSWDKDDDFLQENEVTSEEAPNFSLDLKALSEELVKADLAKRLSIEPDLLPPELRGQDGNEVSNSIPKKWPKTFETFEDLYSIYLADEKIAETEAASKDDTISSSDDTSDSKSRDPCLPMQMAEKDTKMRIIDFRHNVSHVTDQASMPEFRDLVPPADDLSMQDTTPLKFVRDDSETELDMLFNSFSDNNLSNSQRTSKPNLKNISVTHQPAQNTSCLDNELDDLLGACQLKKKSGQFKSIEAKAGPKDDSASCGPLSQHFLDPSRPGFSVSSCRLDDELDNLLQETSKPTEVKVDPFDFPSSYSHPHSKGRVLDDFDSWLDTL